MSIELQYKLKENPNYLKYLKENSYWYKYLNRSNSYLKLFDEEMKFKYKLRPEDRLSKISDSLDTILKFMDILT